MKKVIAALLMSTFVCMAFAEIKSFNFDKNDQGWRSFGGGTGGYNKFIGNKNKGCIAVNVLGGQRSVYQKFNLKPGRYLVKVSVRALGIGNGQWGYSGWFFYSIGTGTKTVVKDIKGSFAWSKGEFTVDVKDKPLEIWWRLKAAGQMWLDDISIEPYKGEKIAWKFEKSKKSLPKGGSPESGSRCEECYRWGVKGVANCVVCGGKLESLDAGPDLASSKPPVKELMTFEVKNESSEKGRHYLTQFSNKATSGKRSAVLKLGAYNNVNVKASGMNDWSGYDYLCMDVYNSTDKKIRLAVCINDQSTGGYWNQLNHVTNLASGWNKLRFRVNRYVGERGAVRIPRYVDLKNIKRFWFSVDPESKRKGKIRQAEFLIDNIRLEKAPPAPKRFKGLALFDFVKEKSRGQRGFIPIMSKHTYIKDVGFGFDKAKIWRSQDSAYADNLHRDAILINKGRFLVDLPNGKYIVRLVPFQLGLWNEHFWTRRKISIEGKIVLNEKRSSAQDYLKNFLQFQDIEPSSKDNPYDLYLKKIFKPIICEVDIKDGQLEIDVDADNSGVALNSLIIYPLANKLEGEEFVAKLDKVQKDDFLNVCRMLPLPESKTEGVINKADKERGFYAPLIGISQAVRYNSILKSQDDKITLRGVIGQRPSQALMLRNLNKDAAVLKISCAALTSKDGSKISVSVRQGIQQYMSHTFNHETFELAPRFLRTFPAAGKKIIGENSILLWLQAALGKNTKPGTYTGSVSLEMHKKKITYPIKLTVYPFTLPDAEIAVGYFGLDPVNFNYYRGNKKDILEFKEKLRFKTLRLIRDYGYTTWSALPDGMLWNVNKKTKFVAPETDKMMAYARKLGFKHKIFSYGGASFLFLDNNGNYRGLPNKQFRDESSVIIKEHIKNKNWLPLVLDYSDEASGYSQKVARDLKRTEVMKKYYPYLRRGGFTHAIKKGKYGYDMNQGFTDPSVSSYSKEFIANCKKRKADWGLYNVAIGLYDNGRACFGEGLFTMAKYGANHLLEWYLTGNQNFPYYDLDGREYDAMMVFPRKDGSLDLALKFEINTQGLEDYRLLLLLEQLANKAGSKGSTARAWLKKNYYDVNIFKTKSYMAVVKKKYSDKKAIELRNKIYSLILSLK